MSESQPRSVQEIPIKSRKQRPMNALLRGRSVERIADNRAAERGKMHPDLMRSSRVQPSLH